jgi:Zn-dependent protease with chaperone function
MLHKRWLIGVVLTVPLIAGVAAYGLRARMNGEMRSEVARVLPDADPARTAVLTVSDVCDRAGSQEAGVCGHFRNLGYLLATAVAAGVAGLGLLLMIRLAGSVAARSRTVLLNAFRPGLYITALGVIGLIAVHGALAVVTLYYLEGTLTGRIHTGVIIAIGMGALAGVLAVARSTFAVVKPAETEVIGMRIDRAAGRQLYQRVEAIAKSLGALRPQHVVVGLDPNFFVTEARVRCLNGTLSGRTLYCSLPLARILSRAEFDAVIGHELGHFRGQDTQFSQRFYPIYRGTADSLRALGNIGVGGAGLLPLLPAVGVMSHFLNAFALAERQHGRVRELAADQDGASVSSPAAMASALVKVHAYSGAWDSACETAIDAAKGRQPIRNLSSLFAGIVTRDASRDLVRSVGAVRTMHPTDSHPPLNVRLEALELPLKKVEAEALQTEPGDAAIGLIDDPDAIEVELSKAFHSVLAQYVNADAGANDDPEP